MKNPTDTRLTALPAGLNSNRPGLVMMFDLAMVYAMVISGYTKIVNFKWFRKNQILTYKHISMCYQHQNNRIPQHC